MTAPLELEALRGVVEVAKAGAEQEAGRAPDQQARAFHDGRVSAYAAVLEWIDMAATHEGVTTPVSDDTEGAG